MSVQKANAQLTSERRKPAFHRCAHRLHLDVFSSPFIGVCSLLPVESNTSGSPASRTLRQQGRITGIPGVTTRYLSAHRQIRSKAKHDRVADFSVDANTSFGSFLKELLAQFRRRNSRRIAVHNIMPFQNRFAIRIAPPLASTTLRPQSILKHSNAAGVRAEGFSRHRHQKQL